jgi:hypothetical protein
MTQKLEAEKMVEEGRHLQVLQEEQEQVEEQRIWPSLEQVGEEELMISPSLKKPMKRPFLNAKEPWGQVKLRTPSA